MNYYISKIKNLPFEETVTRITELLSEQGFGVVSRIDISDKIKAKLGKEMETYTIFGACNPALAWEALQVDDKIGIMLPCNFIVRQKDEQSVEVAVVDPQAVMNPLNIPALAPIAQQAREKLFNAMESL